MLNGSSHQRYRTIARYSGLPLVAFALILVAAARPAAAQSAVATSTPTPPGMPRPGADRLAEPTLPADPSPEDLGAQGFWLHCMPCHGDRGQGLTDDFRAQYPPEDQNCWESGCHGPRPYENGFTLPTTIPAIIGPSALSRFPDAGSLFAFVNAAMPWHDPGSLDVDTYRQIVGFLLRANGRLTGKATPTPSASPTAAAASNREMHWGVVLLVGAAVLLATAGVLGWLSREGRHAAPPS